MSEKKPHKSALSEKEGVEVNQNVNPYLKINRKKYSVDDYFNGIIKNDRMLLSKAITIIESTNSKDSKLADDLLTKCLSVKNKTIRIGITGVPGVGKSTFIEAFGTYLTSIGKKVAVLAVDPSSSVNKGSILGDKTRMENLVKNENAFIRPSPSGNSLGGVARKTRESIILCEAAGFNVILIETVGVGQSETAVHSMVDFFLLLKIAGAGDQLQGIKRGIIEMADSIIINKADGNNIKNAEIAKVEFRRALQMYPKKENNWLPKVLTCSALNNENIGEIWKLVIDYIENSIINNGFSNKRKKQNKYWLYQTIEDKLKFNFYNDDKIKSSIEKTIIEVVNEKTTPFKAANDLLNLKQ